MNNRGFVDLIIKSAADYPHNTFSRKSSIYTCVNPFSYHLVRKNTGIYRKMDGIFVDGMLMCALINLLWKQKIPRLSFDMSGMAVDLFKHLNECEKTIFFIGSEQECINRSIQQIKSTYPNMNIQGYRNGYFTDATERISTINQLVEMDPDFIIVGMGSPLQDKFAIDLKEAGYKGIVFTCGGFLHQTAQGINYYPEWINKYNLRAFYRLYKEKGLFKRLYNVLIEFPFLFTFDTLHTKLLNHK